MLRSQKRGIDNLSENCSSLWFCCHCVKNIFPFQKLTDVCLLKEVDSPSSKSVCIWYSIIDPKTGYDKMSSVCEKCVRVAKSSIPCGNCKHLIHQKCAQLNTFCLNNITSHLNAWECSTCRQDVCSEFPFNNIEQQQDLIDLTFNSNFSWECISTARPYVNFDNLDELEICKISLNEGKALHNNDLDSNLDYSSNFYTMIIMISINYVINCKVNNNIGILHSNICSISKNHKNLQMLLSNLDYNFDIIALSQTWNTDNNDNHIKRALKRAFSHSSSNILNPVPPALQN